MTKIQWTDQVWNPVTGCTKISAGCKHCYAETIANRRLPHGGFTDRPFTEVRCHPDRLDAPLHWKKPRRVFVNSMSDLFHEAVPFDFTVQVFARMIYNRRHTFQVLTKRPARMVEFMRWMTCYKPAPNIWLGVSVENQAAADERIPLLLQTPAAVRFLSCEPLLGPIDLSRVRFPTGCLENVLHTDVSEVAKPIIGKLNGIDWVIVGGESGPGARPCDTAWIRDIVRQCKAAGAPCFVKQLGSRPMWPTPIVNQSMQSIVRDGEYDAGDLSLLLKDRKGGDPSEWPEDLRVREFPTHDAIARALMTETKEQQ